MGLSRDRLVGLGRFAGLPSALRTLTPLRSPGHALYLVLPRDVTWVAHCGPDCHRSASQGVLSGGAGCPSVPVLVVATSITMVSVLKSCKLPSFLPFVTYDPLWGLHGGCEIPLLTPLLCSDVCCCFCDAAQAIPSLRSYACCRRSTVKKKSFFSPLTHFNQCGCREFCLV